MQKALDDALGRYLLTYETHSRSKEPEWRQIQVRVDRQGLTLHARKGVMIDPALSSAKMKREQIAAAQASPVAGIVLRGSDVTQAFGEDIYGPLPQRRFMILTPLGLLGDMKFAEASGLTAVRIVVRDNTTGRIGSITQVLP